MLQNENWKENCSIGLVDFFLSRHINLQKYTQNKRSFKCVASCKIEHLGERQVAPNPSSKLLVEIRCEELRIRRNLDVLRDKR